MHHMGSKADHPTAVRIMRYFGSKISTLPYLHHLVSQHIMDGTFCDPFGGVGSVGSFFKSKGYTVWTGDILNFAHFFQIARVKRSRQCSFRKLRNHFGFDNTDDLVRYINSVNDPDSWFVDEYSHRRQFFTHLNAEKIASCIGLFYRWSELGLFSEDEKKVLLASLIDSMDRVANTAGTYYAYLKKWHRKALNNFTFKLIKPIPKQVKAYCYLEPALDLVQRRHFNVLYLDPPYNERSYARYYHLPETIALQTNPIVTGKSGMPERFHISSDFNRPSKAKTALVNLLNVASFDLLVFHYADTGLISQNEVQQCLASFGTVEDCYITSKGYTTRSASRNINHHIYFISNA